MQTVLLLLLLLGAAGALARQDVTAGPLLNEFTAQIKIEFFNISGQSLYATTFNASVSYPQNKVSISNATPKYGPDASYVQLTDYSEQKTYSFLNRSGSFSYCEWSVDNLTMFGSTIFPDVASAVKTINTTINNIPCQGYAGNDCLLVAFMTTDSLSKSDDRVQLMSGLGVGQICGPFSFYVSVVDGTPVRFIQFIPTGQRLVQIDYTRALPFVRPDAFNRPSDHACNKKSDCQACTTPHVTPIGKYELCNIYILPSWIGAVLVGLGGAYVLMHLGKAVVGSLCYSISFGTYAIMMSSGFVTHCVFLVECGKGAFSKEYSAFLFADSYLTACIAMSFFFNGLIDAKLIPERSKLTLLAMAAVYGGIYYLLHNNILAVEKVYFGSIIIGCGAYVILQIICFFERHSLKGTLYVLLAVLSGFIGVLSVSTLRCWFCSHIGPGSYEGAWYFLSDVSMFFVLRFVVVTRQKIPSKLEELKELKTLQASPQDLELYRL